MIIIRADELQPLFPYTSDVLLEGCSLCYDSSYDAFVGCISLCLLLIPAGFGFFFFKYISSNYAALCFWDQCVFIHF